LSATVTAVRFLWVTRGVPAEVKYIVASRRAVA
jgi:hypothetical protein